MDIVLFRHAQKGLLPFDDPHLSPEGFQQADNIATLVEQKKLPIPTELWVSEKIRTHQTFAVLGKNLAIPLNQKPELNLRNEFENQKSFFLKVKKLIQQICVSSQKDSNSACLFLCTHYDWIEEALHIIPSDVDLSTFEFSLWGPAHHVHFKIKNGIWMVSRKGSKL